MMRRKFQENGYVFDDGAKNMLEQFIKMKQIKEAPEVISKPMVHLNFSYQISSNLNEWIRQN